MPCVALRILSLPPWRFCSVVPFWNRVRLPHTSSNNPAGGVGKLEFQELPFAGNGAAASKAKWKEINSIDSALVLDFSIMYRRSAVVIAVPAAAAGFQCQILECSDFSNRNFSSCCEPPFVSDEWWKAAQG